MSGSICGIIWFFRIIMSESERKSPGLKHNSLKSIPPFSYWFIVLTYASLAHFLLQLARFSCPLQRPRYVYKSQGHSPLLLQKINLLFRAHSELFPNAIISPAVKCIFVPKMLVSLNLLLKCYCTVSHTATATFALFEDPKALSGEEIHRLPPCLELLIHCTAQAALQLLHSSGTSLKLHTGLKYSKNQGGLGHF